MMLKSAPSTDATAKNPPKEAPSFTPMPLPFDFMSKGTSSTPTTASEDTNPDTEEKNPNTAPLYAKGQQVLYRNATVVEIVGVHMEDVLPYYTIMLNGKERQTYNANLSAIPKSDED
jgi:hypothetical protein